MQKKIDFVIVGQPKSGTTALAKFLSEHSEIFITTPKEPELFATDLMKESDEYHKTKKYFLYRGESAITKLLDDSKIGQLNGEGSTNYLYSKDAAKNIKKHNSNAKIIIMLREPVDFVRSLHAQYVNQTLEDETDFETALKIEPKRKKGISLPKRSRAPSLHFYSDRVKYAEQVGRYIKSFPKENIFIMAYEDFRADNETVYADILRFLSVDDTHKPNFISVHGTKSVRLKSLNNLLHTPILKNTALKLLGKDTYDKLYKKVNKVLLKQGGRDNLDENLHAKLKKQYKPEVEKISKLTNKDLVSLWDY